ncbi:gag/pol protein [Cucumis melo var. makuwa]|uniref:Gag/pol protein n=1 Tax=Cucumis melo var. makuwa TaxID=1194695 RepID=A0A5D3DFL4_CUCMM|nr:gag/pol protein [Cucumis melo var. makuwa]TYK22487.1 gag/pol protein [Cucumis melo var. makuwa]
MSDVLAKKHESLATAKEIMDSLKGMFGQPEWSLRHKAIKNIYTKRMKEGISVREHVVDMMMHFNIAEVNGGAIDEANQVTFILNVSRIFTKGKGKEIEANVATTKGKFKRGSFSKSKTGRSKPNRKIEKKGNGKTPKQNKETSSWKRLSEGKITLKVGTREMVSAKAVGDLKLEEDTNISSALLMIILGKTINILRSDRGGEYMDLQFQDYLIEHGIQSQLVAPNTPQQNGVSERRNRTLLDMVRSMMSFAQLPYSFWRYALETAIYILNNVPSKSVSETPYELWKGRKAQIIIPVDGIEDPLTYKQAMNDVDYD